MNRHSNPLILEKSQSWRMFNDISPRYDLLNRILSLGLDSAWRRKLLRFLPPKPAIALLDLATGTADVVITLAQRSPNIKKAVGVDLADKMLEIGRTKISRAGLDQVVTLQRGDAQKIPFSDKGFDCITIAFGIRNIPDTALALREMSRVLKKGGRALILEFSIPQNPLIRFFHLAYLRHIVPLIGGIVSGHFQAYKYLNQTIENFPYGQEFCQLMLKNGFVNATPTQLLWGAATIYLGET